ncbi:MAG: cyanophycinase [Anaerolineales bacterium]|jgi:cyanophycinase
MTGDLLLEGGAEFGGAMAEPDRRAIELAGGKDVPLVIIPTAAAPDNNHQRAGANGRRWFESLGVRQVRVVPLIDRTSAADPQIVEQLRLARLIYLLGGFTHYLGQVLAGTPAWEAVMAAHAEGALIAGSSAGAMVLAEYYFDPQGGRVVKGLNLVPDSCVIPHHDTFGRSWAPRLRALLPDVTLIGIDEQTGMLSARQPGSWRVYGRGAVTVYMPTKTTMVTRSKDIFTLD